MKACAGSGGKGHRLSHCSVEFSFSEQVGVVVLSIIMDSPYFLAIPYQSRLMLWVSCPAGLGCCTDFTIKVSFYFKRKQQYAYIVHSLEVFSFILLV